MAVHVAQIALVPVNAVGTVVNKNQASLSEMCTASSEFRIVPKDSIPNSANYPTIEAYIEAEDGDGFAFVFLNQNMIITRT